MDFIEQFLSRLHHPNLAQIDLKMDRMLRLLSLLGNPHNRLPPVVHVAGTNGKGSLIAYLKAIFEAADLRVHVYTSPHLVQFRERIVLAGNMIDNSKITSLAEHLAKILKQQPATFFEATTALAFLAFSQAKADILLLETGMGGRLDATNVIAKPRLTAITPIDFDHMEFLGDTIEKIAAEKAGIMKRNVACVLGRQNPASLKILVAKAEEVGANLIHFVERELPAIPSLVGEHQLDNASTAISCIEQMPEFGITTAHMAKGIANATWPARLQRLEQGIYRDMLPDCLELWLDGGHNPQGGRVLANWLAKQNKPTYVICGMVGKKDASGYLAAIAPYVKSLWAVAIPSESESKKPSEIEQAAKNAGIAAKSAINIESALQEIAEIALQNSSENAIVMIAGSLYLAGFVLRACSDF